MNRSVVFLGISLFIVFSSPAWAHHILGLPHYSYKENYPQTPTLEYPAQSGPYHILMTCYPGKPVPGESANLAIYIKDMEQDQPYTQPITVRVLQTFTFGRSRDILPARIVPFYEQPHEVTVTFPTDGEYIVELTLEVEGKLEVIPFLMVAGEPTATLSVLAGTGGFLAVFFIVIRAIRIKVRRRLRLEAHPS